MWNDVDRQIGNYIRGKMWEILIVGAVTFLVFRLLGLQYAPQTGQAAAWGSFGAQLGQGIDDYQNPSPGYGMPPPSMYGGGPQSAGAQPGQQVQYDYSPLYGPKRQGTNTGAGYPTQQQY